MDNSVFADFVFDTGWKRQMKITMFGSTYDIIVKLKAYFDKDGITPEQEAAFLDFGINKDEKLNESERRLIKYSGENASARFIPRTLLFERNGSYALLLDDLEDPDDGVAVLLDSVESVLSQSEYL